MESQNQKWVSISYLAAAALLAYILFAAGESIASIYDLEARVKDIGWVIRGVSLAGGLILFIGLYTNDKANQFMHEVVTELSRVTWPTAKETMSATVVVIIMVLISGLFLGLLDYLWTQLIQWIL